MIRGKLLKNVISFLKGFFMNVSVKIINNGYIIMFMYT